MRTPLVLLGAVLITTACGGGSSTGPTSTPTSVQAPLWQGTVRYSRRTLAPPLDETMLLTGNVTWVKQVDPNPAPLAGAASYVIQSGSLTVTHTGGPAPCAYQGGTTHTLKASDGYLVLNTDGSYSGYIRSKTATFPTTVACPGVGSATLPEDEATIDLAIKGQVANLRLQGEMPALTVASSTFSGSWDFFYQVQ